jgi:hypothetical protein
MRLFGPAAVGVDRITEGGPTGWGCLDLGKCAPPGGGKSRWRGGPLWWELIGLASVPHGCGGGSYRVNGPMVMGGKSGGQSPGASW